MGRASLLLVTGMIIIFGMVQIGINGKISMAKERSSDYFEQVQAKNIANSLVERAIRKIKDNLAWRAGIQEDAYLSGSGDLQIFDASTDSSLGPNELLIASTGAVGNIAMDVEVRLRRTSFSKYSYFTDREPGIYFITGDTVKGPLHTNGTMHISGRPVFTGRVTSPNMWQGSGDPEFLGGSSFGSQEVNLPTNLDNLKNAVSSGGLQLDRTSRVEFQPDSTIDVYEWSGGWGWWGGSWSGPTTYNQADIGSVISSTEDVYVKGVVNGPVTLHSEDDIIIDGDITYQDDPRDNPDSDDMLGLISERKIIVDRDAHLDHGTQDLTIHASLMALGNTFTVENYGSGHPRGSLNILGGVIQEVRGAVGTFISGGSNPVLRSGYMKVYEYDQRFLNRWPPHFPVSDTYSILAWRE
ncbi:MAG TPA: DUF4900 domain-containing protein [bacterium]|nr:DUF4900 domain-containing protein [bacterium]